MTTSVEAQEAYKIDETTYLRCDLSEVPQLTDSPMPIFKALDENTNSKVTIVVFGMEGFALRYAQNAKRWLSEIRGVKPERLLTLYGGPSDEARLELWLIPQGAQPPQFKFSDDYKNASKFDEYSYMRGEYCDPSRPPALSGFAGALKQRPGWQGYIIVRRNPKEHLSHQQALSYAATDKRHLIRKFGLSSARLKMLVGDNDAWTHAEVWLVPPGAELPVVKVKSSNRGR